MVRLARLLRRDLDERGLLLPGPVLVLVCGGRTFGLREAEREFVYTELDKLHAQHHFSALIEGGASGADERAEIWAMKNGVQVVHCPANWGLYGKSAGPRRNLVMLALRPDMVVAFPGGTGTKHMVDAAVNAGVPVVRLEMPKESR